MNYGKTERIFYVFAVEAIIMFAPCAFVFEVDVNDSASGAVSVCYAFVKDAYSVFVKVKMLHVQDFRYVLLNVDFIHAVGTGRVESLAFCIPFIATMRTLEMPFFDESQLTHTYTTNKLTFNIILTNLLTTANHINDNILTNL